MQNNAIIQPKAKLKRRSGFWEEVKKYKGAYLMAIPGILFYLIFLYGPMFGVIIAFQDYSPALGFFKSDWVGLKHFQDFCSSAHFVRTVRNTVTISMLDLLLSFPAPIILALLLNELKAQKFKKIVQTITYIPHFISLVVICGMISAFAMKDGVINVVTIQNDGTARDISIITAAYQDDACTKLAGVVVDSAKLDAGDLHKTVTLTGAPAGVKTKTFFIENAGGAMKPLRGAYAAQ